MRAGPLLPPVVMSGLSRAEARLPGQSYLRVEPEHKTITQSDCGPEMEGISCDYGSTLCCGETFPEIVLTCMGGSWEGYYIDTPCILFPGHTFEMTSHDEMQRQ